MSSSELWSTRTTSARESIFAELSRALSRTDLQVCWSRRLVHTCGAAPPKERHALVVVGPVEPDQIEQATGMLNQLMQAVPDAVIKIGVVDNGDECAVAPSIVRLNYSQHRPSGRATGLPNDPDESDESDESEESEGEGEGAARENGIGMFQRIGLAQAKRLLVRHAGGPLSAGESPGEAAHRSEAGAPVCWRLVRDPAQVPSCCS